MQKITDFKAVIFDMDGLVLNTETTYIKAWQQAANELGYHLSDAFCNSLSGLPFSQVEIKLQQHLGSHFPFKDFYQLSASLWRAAVEREGIAVKKGVKGLIQLLRTANTPYCLATNSPELNARECLQYAGIEHLFSLIVCSDHVQAPKPAPDLFLQAAKILQQDIQHCLVIEDSLTGLLAAKNAQASVLLVPSMPDVNQQMLDLAMLVMNDLSEFAQYLREALDNQL